MDIKNKKSAWAALATLGITAVAAGATAIVKIREKRRESKTDEPEQEGMLTAEQMMVYNEAVSAFKTINKRIYELRTMRKELQPVIKWLATNGEKPDLEGAPEEISVLAKDIEKFLTTQVPFINACLCTISDNGMDYRDHVRGSVGGCFDATLDEEPTGAVIENGTPIAFVLKLGYCFPGSHDASEPVKSIVVV